MALSHILAPSQAGSLVTDEEHYIKPVSSCSEDGFETRLGLLEIKALPCSSLAREDSTITVDSPFHTHPAPWSLGYEPEPSPPSWLSSCRAILTSSWLNVLLVFIPLSWTSHFLGWNAQIEFAFSLCSIIPLEKLFEFGGEELARHLGSSMGDLVTVTLHNAVEVTLSIILLVKCELKLLQSTVIGVILLNLLLIPGMAFLTGGSKIWQQHLAETSTQLNQTLLIIGVMSLAIPIAFFTGIRDHLDSHDMVLDSAHAIVAETLPLHSTFSDPIKYKFVQMSRGMAFILLSVYIGSRIYLHNPPGHREEHQARQAATLEKFPQLGKHYSTPAKLNLGSCIILLIISVMLMAVGAEWLVDAIDTIQERWNFSDAWFGMIVLPLTAFSADALITIAFFLRSALFLAPTPPEELAKGRAIDMSVQFILLWMPFLVIVAWVLERPFLLLFDVFEVASIIAACFLVNYVTQDAKTNWAEGVIMVAFYVIIALAAWLYPGQVVQQGLLLCFSAEGGV